jgi:hypothetical protein
MNTTTIFINTEYYKCLGTDPIGGGVINLPYLVGGEEYYPWIVFQGLQEHGDESISMDILN